MMITNSRDEEPSAKQEGGMVDERAASSRLWPGLRNPRIIRVSRAFGGKDRHSKVSTIRGLRDRRIRLSVPTAIQLYDLQDRLGLSQPSKVVDWLLNAAKDEVDKLPPLPMLPGNFIQFSQSLAMARGEARPKSPSHSNTMNNTSGYKNGDGALPLSLLSSKSTSEDMSDAVAATQDPDTIPKSTYWNSDASPRARQREDQREFGIEKGSFMRSNQLEAQDIAHYNAQVSANDPHFRASHSSFLGLQSNNMPYTSYFHSEASNAYASQLGVHPSQMEVHPTFIPSALSLAPGSQLVLCPSGSSISSMFPSYMAAPNGFDARQIAHIQMANMASQDLSSSHPMRTYLHSAGHTVRHFHSDMASKLPDNQET